MAAPKPFVPTLELTAGQPTPIAANDGLSYMSFDRQGDAGTHEAIKDALTQIASGEVERLDEQLVTAPPGPIATKWGNGFRRYAECLEYIKSQQWDVPEGGIVLPMRYSVYEHPSYSVVSSNALWHDPTRAEDAAALRRDEQANNRRCLYFPQVLRDARRISEYHPGLDPTTPECMDKLGVVEIVALGFTVAHGDAQLVHTLG